MDLNGGDLFAEESGPVVNHARGRFRPKAKPRPSKETTAPIGIINKENRVLDPVGSSVLSSEAFRTVEQLKENESSKHALHSSFQKAVGKNADVHSGLNSLNDFPSQPTNGTELSDLIGYNEGEGVATEGQSSDSNTAPAVCEPVEAQTCADLCMTHDPISCGQATLTNNAGDTNADDARLEPEVQQDGAFPDLNCLDFTSEEAVASGWHYGKYKLMPEMRTDGEKCNASVHHPDAVESVMHLPNAQFVASGTQGTSDGSIAASVPEDFFDYSSIDLGDTNPPVLTSSEFLVNEEVTNIVETSQIDAASSGDVQREDFPAITENQGLMESSFAGEEMEDKKLSRQLRKRPKKFSHSTRRRKRRIVSRELLETPEDEIDPQKVPMKDLILLAEYKERLATKEAKATGMLSTSQGAELSSREEDYYNEDETFASEQGNGSIGDQVTDRAMPRVHYYNYQSFMKRTPNVRWSKQETELFYKAVRQFGTDLSMIQQLFPGRTRQQVKLKYKKEEREQPWMLTEALKNRADDHSHFEKVIEQLRQVAAQAAEDAKQDDSAGMTDEEVEELNPKHNDKEEKIEQDQNGEGDVNEEDHSPMKVDECDEDDDDIWSSYKTEF